jgi:5-methyltetrahydropteroyltriglutamate--homocysteine methyltransferase
VRDFRSAAPRAGVSGVDNTTALHTHMCYSEFNDTRDTIVRMDVDVISIRVLSLDILTPQLLGNPPCGVTTHSVGG